MPRPATTARSGGRISPMTRPVGRPRVDQRPRKLPPKEEILVAAGQLFAENGFAGTSTRAIAQAAGLRQGGIYHYYSQKVDILEALAQQMSLPSMKRLAEVDSEAITPSAKLYRFLFLDLLGLSSLPYDIAALFSLREVRTDRFRRFWKQRRRILATLEHWIREGVARGEFSADDPKLAAIIALATQESTFSWYRYRQRDKRSPAVVATAVADQIVRSLLRDPSRLGIVRRESSHPPR